MTNSSSSDALTVIAEVYGKDVAKGILALIVVALLGFLFLLAKRYLPRWQHHRSIWLQRRRAKKRYFANLTRKKKGDVEMQSIAHRQRERVEEEEESTQEGPDGPLSYRSTHLTEGQGIIMEDERRHEVPATVNLPLRVPGTNGSKWHKLREDYREQTWRARKMDLAWLFWDPDGKGRAEYERNREKSRIKYWDERWT